MPFLCFFWLRGCFSPFSLAFPENFPPSFVLLEVFSYGCFPPIALFFSPSERFLLVWTILFYVSPNALSYFSFPNPPRKPVAPDGHGAVLRLPRGYLSPLTVYKPNGALLLNGPDSGGLPPSSLHPFFCSFLRLTKMYPLFPVLLL